MKWLVVLTIAAAGCDTYRFYHFSDGGETRHCPACGVSQVCNPTTHACDQAVAHWEELDGSASGAGVSAGPADELSVAVDEDGAPVVAWSSAGEVYVRRWHADAWEALGNVSASSASSSVEPHVAIDASQRITVAWTEGDDAATEIYARRWDGTGWEELAGSASNGGVSNTLGLHSMQPRLALSHDGLPVIAWLQEVPGYAWQIYARAYDGSGWRELGDSATADGVSKSPATGWSPAIGVGPDDNPCVAWTDSSVLADVRMRCWNGVTWGAVGSSTVAGGISPANSQGWDASVAIDSLGRTWLSWRGDATTRWEAYVRYFDAAWTELAGSSRVSDDVATSDQAVMTLDGQGQPVVAWQQAVTGGTTIWGSYWNGSSWAELAGFDTPVTGAGDAARPVIAVAPSGHVVLAWLESSRAYLKRLH